MTGTDLALPDPQTVAGAQVPAIVSRAEVLRSEFRDSGDVQGADELRRQLAAFERYVADKKARAALEAESRRTEALLGELLGQPPGRGANQGLSQALRKLHPEHHAMFWALSQHIDLLEDRLAAGVTTRAKILVAIERHKMVANGADVESKTRIGDFREVLADLPDNSVDMIFTDPPYNKKAVELYGDLAEFGARVLKPGASLLAYCGQYALTQILVDMEASMRYWWMCACVHDGGNHKSLAGIKAYVLWKPIVWFVKETNGADEFVYDAILRPAPDKTSHDWAQAMAEPLHYIEKLCPPGGLVCDPFAGGGTTQLAAEQIGRRFVGAELSADQEAIATGRQAA